MTRGLLPLRACVRAGVPTPRPLTREAGCQAKTDKENKGAGAGAWADGDAWADGVKFDAAIPNEDPAQAPPPPPSPPPTVAHTRPPTVPLLTRLRAQAQARIEAEYRELDRLFGSDGPRLTTARSVRPRARRVPRTAAGGSLTGSRGGAARASVGLSAAGLGAAGSGRGSLKKIRGLDDPRGSNTVKRGKMRQRLDKSVAEGPGRGDGDEFAAAAADDAAALREQEVLKVELEESYEELQRLLGHKPKSGRRGMNSAAFTGDMDKHRQAGMFKAVTLKDPLQRVYAQRLQADPGPEPAPGAIERPAKPGAAPAPPAELAPGFVEATLQGLGDAPAPQKGRAVAPRAGGRAGNGKAKPTGRQGSAAAAAAAGVAVGEKGRVVLNHSTNLEGLVAVLERIAEVEGIATLVPGRIAKANSSAPRLRLTVSVPTDTGFKMIARLGTQAQEVFAVTDLEQETLEAAIAWSL